MNRNSLLLGILIGGALLASIGASPATEQVGRYQIIQTHYEIIVNGVATGGSDTGLTSAVGWTEMNDKLKTTRIPGAKETK